MSDFINKKNSIDFPEAAAEGLSSMSGKLVTLPPTEIQAGDIGCKMAEKSQGERHSSVID